MLSYLRPHFVLTMLAAATGCLHTPAPAPEPVPAPQPVLPAGPLSMVTDGTLFHPNTGVNLTLALNLPPEQDPHECRVTFSLVDSLTGEVKRTVEQDVVLSKEGGAELKDVFKSRYRLEQPGQRLPEGRFNLVATLHLGSTEFRAQQAVRVEVRGDWCATERMSNPLLQCWWLLTGR